jgi:hypothetical protein
MPPRGPEAAIAKFLRDALARDDVGVPTLEVMARRAGLLGEHQRITHAKLFRAAKKNLGIIRVEPVLVLGVSGSGNCHDRIQRRSNQSQDQSREHLFIAMILTLSLSSEQQIPLYRAQSQIGPLYHLLPLYRQLTLM